MIIFPLPPGQLCNQLFCIAHMAAASMETGVNSSFPGFGYPLECFPGMNSDSRIRVARRPRFLSRASSLFYRSLQRLCPGSPFHVCLTNHQPPFVDLASQEVAATARSKVVICEGWGLRAVNALGKHRAAVSDLLRLSDKVVRNADAFIESLKPCHGKLVFGFHIRRGDYRSYRNGEYFFSDGDWQRWIGQCRDLAESQGARFQGIAVSNESINEIVGECDDVVVGPGAQYEDLAVLSKCDYIVGPPSTYSGWASFAGRRPIMVLERSSAICDLNKFHVVDW